MKRVLLLFPLLLVTAPAWGQAPGTPIDKPFDIPGWTITILPLQNWQAAARQYDLKTASAFTILGNRHTYMNPDYVWRVTPDKLRHTLAHEAGHILCDCNDEKDADRAAEKLLTEKSRSGTDSHQRSQ